MIKIINNKSLYDFFDYAVERFDNSLIELRAWNGNIEDFLDGYGCLMWWCDEDENGNNIGEPYDHTQDTYDNAKDFVEDLFNEYACGFGDDYEYVGLVIDKKLVWCNKLINGIEEKGECWEE